MMSVANRPNWPPWLIAQLAILGAVEGAVFIIAIVWFWFALRGTH